MKIYVRYAFFQTLKIFFLSLLAATVCLVFFFIVECSIKRGVPIDLAFKTTPFILPDALSKTLPIAALLAATLFFSRMAGANEIIAIKAMGIAPWRILAPVWIFMFFVSLSSVWMNDLSTSWSRRQMTSVLLNGFESTVLGKLKAEKRFATPNGKFVLEATGVDDDGVLLNPSFSAKGANGDEISGIAKSVRLDVDAENQIIWARLENAEIEASGGAAILQKTSDLAIPLREFFDAGYRVDPPASRIAQEIERVDAERAENRRRLATRAAFAFLRGDLDETTRPDWRERAYFERELDRKRNRYRHAIPRIWASGFACFFFVWVGAPFAIWFNKADYTAAFFACFLPVLVVYYPLFMFGVEGAKNGVVPPSFVWLGNVALGLVGFWFLKKIH